MSVESIKYSFVSGEISPTMLGRSDLDKYDLSAAEVENFFVDYRGGLSNRPGEEFVDLVQADWFDTKFIPFKFGPGVDTSYVILLGSGYIRFFQNGGYVLEAGKAFTTISAAAPGVVSAVAHGYSTGDLVKLYDIPASSDLTKFGFDSLNGQTFVVGAVTANTFELKHLDQAVTNYSTAGFDTVPARTGNAYRVYTLANPYASTDFEMIKTVQSRSVIDFTHASYAPRRLTRISGANWTFSLINVGPALAAPAVPTLTPSAAGTAGMAYCVTAVDSEGNESLPSPYGFNALSVDFTVVAGSMKVTWAAVAGAQFYKVYRTQVLPIGGDITRAQQMGLVGVTFGPDFTDANAVPDFTQGPPIYNNPFSNAGIKYVQVTAGGAGYTRASVVTMSGGGTGFVGYPVVSSGGVLLAIVIVNGGQDYVAPAASISIGAGATTVVTVDDATGNYPRVSKVFQQRMVRGGSDNDPLRVNGSQPRKYELFDESAVLVDSDAYEFEVDAQEVAPITNMTTTRSGLLLWTAAGMFQITGDGQVAVTPTGAIAQIQSYAGAQAQLLPLQIDTDLLYVEAKGNTVRLVSYTDYTKVFSSQDMSILANHLITPNNKIIAWDFASDPTKLVHAVRDDGSMLVLALVKEQNIFGWSRYVTSGLYLDVLVVQENSKDVPYLMTQRFFDSVNGTPRLAKVVTRIIPREYDSVEDAKFLDCSLIYGENYPDAELTIGDLDFAATGTAISNVAAFGAGDVGKYIRVGGGKFVITAYTDTTHVTVRCERELTKTIPAPSPYWRAKSGHWTMDAPITVVNGLSAYEGQTVKVLADGNVLADKVVTFGRVSLGTTASRVYIGFGYRGLVRTLPLTAANQVVEGRIKRPLGAKIRVGDTRGLQSGSALDKLESVHERTTEPFLQATKLQNGMQKYFFDGAYDDDGQFYFVQDYPLPVTILSFVADMEVGDAESA